jgi:hypothetical protein
MPNDLSNKALAAILADIQDGRHELKASNDFAEESALCMELRASIQLSKARFYQKALEDHDDAWLGRMIRSTHYSLFVKPVIEEEDHDL